MSSLKGRIARLLSNVAMKRAEIVSVSELGGFSRLLLRCEPSGYEPGTKVQLLLPSDDMRTYSPIRAPEGMVLLGWKHAGGPGSRWLASARAGDEVPFVGPQRSLALDAARPAIVVGDETSVAVAAALSSARPGRVHAVLQSDAADDVRAAAESVGLDAFDLVPRADTAATVRAILAKRSTTPDAIVALTGGSELVTAVRDALRREGVRDVKTKAYWIPGRTGLD
ncbi:MAG TPA: hypothetical protein VIL20_29960 [Sandaracinaceae bacterium]